MGVEAPSKMGSQSDRKSYFLFVWHRFISFRNGVVKYEKEHSLMYQGPHEIGTNYTTEKGMWDHAWKENAFGWGGGKLCVEYFYFVHEGPLLEFSSIHLNDILLCFIKMNFNNIIQSLVEAGRSLSPRGRWGASEGLCEIFPSNMLPADIFSSHLH